MNKITIIHQDIERYIAPLIIDQLLEGLQLADAHGTDTPSTSQEDGDSHHEYVPSCKDLKVALRNSISKWKHFIIIRCDQLPRRLMNAWSDCNHVYCDTGTNNCRWVERLLPTFDDYERERQAVPVELPRILNFERSRNHRQGYEIFQRK